MRICRSYEQCRSVKTRSEADPDYFLFVKYEVESLEENRYFLGTIKI